MKPIRVLLLTNRDSDNVGDQIIEASAIALLKTVARNLGITEAGFAISSRAAGIIPKKYMKTGDESLLRAARKAISSSDLVVFGGAPLFNYRYQSFYKRTIRTLELANEYHVPVLFSSVGVEPFDAENAKSQALRNALQLPVVRQVTTRDDLESVEKYMNETGVPTALVADPAVYADSIFADIGHRPKGNKLRPKKVVGLVVTRAGIFADNGIEFSERDQRKLWLDVIDRLVEDGYDYRLFTTGHFTDEIFLDSLVRDHGIPTKHVAFAVNSPDELIAEMRKCYAIIAFRLHASITAYALGVPSIGLSWNFKVPDFYRGIGYESRAIPSESWDAETVVRALESAVSEGIKKDPGYHYSVYVSLFEGVRGVISPNGKQVAYTYDEVLENIPRYEGTSPEEYRKKIQRKLRRSYEHYAKVSRVRESSPKSRRAILKSKISQVLSDRQRRLIRRIIR